MSFSKKEVKQLKSLLSGNQPQPKKKSKRSRKSAAVAPSLGSMRITRKDLVASTLDDKKTSVLGNFVFSGQNCPTLRKFGSLFAEFRLIGNIIIEYVPSCSSTSEGSLLIGASAVNDATAARERAKIASLSPSTDTPVWQKTTLTISPSLYQKAKGQAYSFADNIFYLYWGVNVASAGSGELWVKYTVDLISPKA